MNIYVGNLNFRTSQEELTELFSAHGEVSSTKIITDKFTHRSKGYGFVEMPNDNEAEAAINALNGTEVGGRTLTVNKAREREERD